MIALAHLADILSLLGFGVGLWRWSYFGRSSKWLTVFLGVSAACGFGQSLLFHLGYHTAWAGNVWDLALLTLFIPACMFRMQTEVRQYIRPLLTIAIGMWVLYNVAVGELPIFDNYLSLTFYGLLSIVGAMMLYRFLDDSIHLLYKPGFLIGLVALSVGLSDSLLSLALSHYASLSQDFLVDLMVFRNTVWCGAYVVLGYSLFLEGGIHEPESKRNARVQPAPRDPQSHRRGHFDSGRNRMGWQP